MLQTIKPTRNPKSLQKQHGYKINYKQKNINNIYSKPSFLKKKPSLSKPVITTNYPKHKQNKQVFLTAPPQHSAPLQGLLLRNFSPFFTGMAKGSLPMMCGEAVKFCGENIKLILHGCHPFKLHCLDLSESIKSFQDDLKCIWRSS